jgi:diguanylate cyclase (GGDEF)-like protein
MTDGKAAAAGRRVGEAAAAIAQLQQLEQENERLRATIDQMRAAAEQLQTLADSDTLTPLVNRRRFLFELERMLAAVRRYRTSAMVLFADVDGLKAINDRYGHAAGDAALIHVAQLLLGNVRKTDLVARIAGDEFGLLLDHLDEPAASAKVASLAEAIAAARMDWEGDLILVMVSLGMTPLRAEDSVETVLARADAAMYEARRARRAAIQ